uniref:Uncharacterized protein n=1 Tax=Cajanus cajan TaxID=3821 RepID=A0A151TXB9_CAJCA|nr:hypothetical protein KK1_010868 [Cajanus cajan]
MRTTNDKTARWIQMKNCFLIQVLLRYNRLNNMLFEVSCNLIIGNSFIVLSRNQDCVDTHRDHSTIVIVILHCDLSLSISIKANIIGHKAYGTTRVTHNLLIVYISLCCDLSKHHDQVGLGTGLTSNLALWILVQAGIKDCIRNLVTKLVGVTFIH